MLVIDEKIFGDFYRYFIFAGYRYMLLDEENVRFRTDFHLIAHHIQTFLWLLLNVARLKSLTSHEWFAYLWVWLTRIVTPCEEQMTHMNPPKSIMVAVQKKFTECSHPEGPWSQNNIRVSILLWEQRPVPSSILQSTKARDYELIKRSKIPKVPIQAPIH